MEQGNDWFVWLPVEVVVVVGVVIVVGVVVVVVGVGVVVVGVLIVVVVVGPDNRRLVYIPNCKFGNWIFRYSEHNTI